jgi:hypothetical protein
MYWIHPAATTNPFGHPTPGSGWLNSPSTSPDITPQMLDARLARIEALLTRIAVQLEAPK